MATPERQELIRNAVSFLSDPKTQASPVAQRIQFLEAKGLNGPDIDEALKRAALNRSDISPYGSSHLPIYGPSAYQPPPQQWDWRDYFITAVVSGSVAYGAITLFRKYLLPHLRPPSATAYEEDREALNAQFDAAEALLKEIQAETAAVRAAVDEQRTRVEQTTEAVSEVVKEMREGETKMRDEMREIRDEVENIREMLPKMIEKTKDNQTQSLADLQQELKSLKALLLNRGPGVSTGSTTPPPLTIGRPSIPAWQLAGASSSSSRPADPSPAPIPSAPSSIPETSVVDNGKGKEVIA